MERLKRIWQSSTLLRLSPVLILVLGGIYLLNRLGVTPAMMFFFCLTIAVLGLIIGFIQGIWWSRNDI